MLCNCFAPERLVRETYPLALISAALVRLFTEDRAQTGTIKADVQTLLVSTLRDLCFALFPIRPSATELLLTNRAVLCCPQLPLNLLYYFPHLPIPRLLARLSINPKAPDDRLHIHR
jgi:hypothetical protein